MSTRLEEEKRRDEEDSKIMEKVQSRGSISPTLMDYHMMRAIKVYRTLLLSKKFIMFPYRPSILLYMGFVVSLVGFEILEPLELESSNLRRSSSS